jgi:hypothetical protein
MKFFKYIFMRTHLHITLSNQPLIYRKWQSSNDEILFTQSKQDNISMNNKRKFNVDSDENDWLIHSNIIVKGTWWIKIIRKQIPMILLYKIKYSSIEILRSISLISIWSSFDIHNALIIEVCVCVCFSFFFIRVTCSKYNEEEKDFKQRYHWFWR